MECHDISIRMVPIKTNIKETPLDFVERANALGVDEEAINDVLKERFGFIDDGEMKALKLQSKPFWERFYLDRVSELLKRGGSKYSAIRLVQRKNVFAEQRRKLSDEEIKELVDSVGEWPR
jgi:hypothetical protein